jgi:hypothetical protein
MSLVVWIGGIIFFTFFGAPSIFKTLDRELAGSVVGDIFPKYWFIGYVCSATALGSLIYLWKQGISGASIRIILLGVMTVSTYYTGLCVGSKAREIKAEIRTTEDLTRKDELRNYFTKIHRRSMVLNVIILTLGIVTIFMTAWYTRI